MEKNPLLFLNVACFFNIKGPKRYQEQRRDWKKGKEKDKKKDEDKETEDKKGGDKDDREKKNDDRNDSKSSWMPLWVLNISETFF